MGERGHAQLAGVGIGNGTAMGAVRRMPDPIPEPANTPCTRPLEEELSCATAALESTASFIRARSEQVDGEARNILDAQLLMAEDPAVLDEVTRLVVAGKTAERAIFEGYTIFRNLLSELDSYLAERVSDIDDIMQRTIAYALGVPAPGVPESEVPFVLVARDLAPADTVTLDLDKVLAFVTTQGGPTSHTAILAREKGIVALVGVADARSLVDGELVIVDAAEGVVTVSPSKSEQQAARIAIEKRAARTTLPASPGALADGTLVPLLANLGSADGAADAVANGAEGVGLFRTEFLFLGASEAPSVEEQQIAYAKVLAAFPGQKVVIRVLDAGADKPLDFLESEVEQNPALGQRGIRALLANEGILRDQLQAIAGAVAQSEAEAWVMAPMVSTVDEASAFGAIAKEYGLQTVGVMVEVPSCALIADRILAVSDFASIGTNDLTQYTLAADRLQGSLASFQSAWHPAVLRLVGEVGAAGAALDKPVGVCGEAASDPLLAVVLVGLGVTSLSMSPAALSDVRVELARYSLAQAREFAELALGASGAEGAQHAVRAAAN